MYVQKVSLENFRNYALLDLELSQGINVLYGDNAQGKTNFLEAVYLCSAGRSQRTANIRELIAFGYDNAHIRVIVKDGDTNLYSKDRIDAHLKKDSGKGIALNGSPIKKIGQLFGILLTVVFSPEDLQLLKSGPGERRKFLDVELCQLSAVYYYELQQYFHILKQRNNLLKSARTNKELLESIFIWDEQLINHGRKIINFRTDFIRDITSIAGEIHSAITRGGTFGSESLCLVYKPNVSADYFEEKLKKSIDRDLSSGATNVGIHKDDVIFLVNGSDARMYGSQGQQRTACLSAKLAEIKLIERQKNKSPVLLLDDVLSELDSSRQNFLLEHVKNVQTLITCTGMDGIERTKNMIAAEDCRVFKVENGDIMIYGS